jgi:pimeloyl-ACP methyl ester carboxylesterase
MRAWALVLAISVFACVNVKVDEGEAVGQLPPTDGAFVEFNPSEAEIPFPNLLALSPTTGKVMLPPQCGESATAQALREQGLNALDGFGTFKAAQRITFSEPVDMVSLADNIFLYAIETGAGPADPLTAEPIPVLALPAQTTRFDATCENATTVAAVNIIPLLPLEENSQYVTVLQEGVTSASGQMFLPTPTFALVRQAQNPVTVENGVVVAERTPLDPKKPEDNEVLLGLDMLWKVHAKSLAFVDVARGQPRDAWVIAYPFKTQTLTLPLNPSEPGTPAAMLAGNPLVGVTSITGGDTQAFLEGALGAPTCAQVGCAFVGDVVAGGLVAPRYQIELPSPIGGDPVNGPWSDPLAPQKLDTDAIIQVLAAVPEAAPPENGYPTIVFAHAVSRSRQDVIAIVSQLAKLGFATVAIDLPAHGDRAVQISNEVALGCGGEPDPTAAPQCFAPFLSADLTTTRDNFRQAALDMSALVKALKACDGDCGPALKVDPAKIGYLGQSLGAMVGTLVVGMNADIKVAVLNAGGGGLIDLIENTDNALLRCPLVDALIQQGVIVGELSDLPNPTGACFEDDWKTQPNYLEFANIARWLLDPADAINYASHLVGRPVLLQKIGSDELIPSVFADQQAAVIGLSAFLADPATVAAPAPTAMVVGPTPKYVAYPDLAADGPFPGNTFSHASLLQPANADPDGQLGTARLQADALGFLSQLLLP